MAKDVVEKDGIVTEALMGGMFRVQMDDPATAGQSEEDIAIGVLSGKLRKFRIRILTGDRVKMEFSPTDLTRGRITFRYRPGEKISEREKDKNS